MRKPVVAGNWKMVGGRHQALGLLQGLADQSSQFSHTEMIVIPSYVHLLLAEHTLEGSRIQLAAQNLSEHAEGAYTGEISASMLKDYGCHYVLVGHSERRAIYQESLEQVAAKCAAALQAGLTPILCVGETEVQREAGQTESIIQAQLESALKIIGKAGLQKLMIAYEPVWAIGTGLTATPDQAQSVHSFIRKVLAKMDEERAKSICLLYGGSVKADNAAGLFAMPDIDGALVGGASLQVASFLQICQAAEQQVILQESKCIN